MPMVLLRERPHEPGAAEPGVNDTFGFAKNILNKNLIKKVSGTSEGKFPNGSAHSSWLIMIHHDPS